MDFFKTFPDAKSVTAESLKREIHQLVETALKAAGTMYLHGKLLGNCFYCSGEISEYEYSDMPNTICNNFLIRLEQHLSEGNPLLKRTPLNLKWTTKGRYPQVWFDGLTADGLADMVEQHTETTVGALDFDALVCSLSEKLATVDVEARVGYCDDLIKVVAEYEHQPYGKGAKVADKGRFYSINDFARPISDWHYPSAVAHELRELAELFRFVGDELGFEFGPALVTAAHEVGSLGITADLESRTRWGKGMPLDLVYFKSGFKCQVSIEAMDAVQTFVMLHGTEAQQQRLIDTRNPPAAEAA